MTDNFVTFPHPKIELRSGASNSLCETWSRSYTMKYNIKYYSYKTKIINKV